MFRPNQKAHIRRAVSANIHGQLTYGDPAPVGIAIIRLQHQAEKTPVRTDSSASRGSSEQETLDGVILMEKTVTPRIDDQVIFDDVTYRVVSSEKRISVFGKLDHYQVGLAVLL